MRAQLTVIVLALLLSAVASGAGIERFVDDRTALAAQADLTKADPTAIDQWVTETFKAANLMAPAGPGPTDAELRQGMDRMKRWLADAKAQGATNVYIVAADEMTRFNPFAVIFPVDDAKAKAEADARLKAAIEEVHTFTCVATFYTSVVQVFRRWLRANFNSVMRLTDMPLTLRALYVQANQAAAGSVK